MTKQLGQQCPTLFCTSLQQTPARDCRSLRYQALLLPVQTVANDSHSVVSSAKRSSTMRCASAFASTIRTRSSTVVFSPLYALPHPSCSTLRGAIWCLKEVRASDTLLCAEYSEFIAGSEVLSSDRVSNFIQYQTMLFVGSTRVQHVPKDSSTFFVTSSRQNGPKTTTWRRVQQLLIQSFRVTFCVVNTLQTNFTIEPNLDCWKSAFVIQ